MKIKIVMGHYTPYDNRFQVKTVDRVIDTTAQELIITNSPINVLVNNFWQFHNGKFVDFYEVPDVFQPELLTENTK